MSVTQAVPAPQLRDPAWLPRVFWGSAALIALVPMLIMTEFKPWLLWQADSLKSVGNFLKDMFPPAMSAEFLALVAKETWRTVAIATAGISLALLIAVPFAIFGTRVLSVSALTGRMALWPASVRFVMRGILIVLRSVPELVWALVFVRVAGLGATAGVLAIAIAYGGMLGKVYIEILESSDLHATQSLLRNGASRMQALLYGLIPQNASELTSYTVYRWECAIRSSAVLGFVGAGGLGQQLDTSMKMFKADEASTLLIVFVFLVWFADRVSDALRKALDAR